MILNTDYTEFLRWLYDHHKGLEQNTYNEQMQIRTDSLFGMADFYSFNLRKLGHEAWDIFANNEFMQEAWANQCGIRISKKTSNFWSLLRPVRRVANMVPLRYLKLPLRPLLRTINKDTGWLYRILEAQIKFYKPDILLNLAMDAISSRFLKELKPSMRLLVGQHAAPLPDDKDYGCYDLVVSSLKNFVDYFRNRSVPAELLPLGFENRILDKLEKENRQIPVSFVGSLSTAHEGRIHLLEYLCQHFDIQVWGQGIEGLPRHSAIRNRYKGKAWGIDMFEILCSSKITLNHHIGVAGSYANNMRLYEATGVGAMLITDFKENLRELFEIGREVVGYRTPEECLEQIRHFLDNDQERDAIGLAGQKRTLREHTYYQRMEALVDIVNKFLH